MSKISSLSRGNDMGTLGIIGGAEILVANAPVANNQSNVVAGVDSEGDAFSSMLEGMVEPVGELPIGIGLSDGDSSKLLSATGETDDVDASLVVDSSIAEMLVSQTGQPLPQQAPMPNLIATEAETEFLSATPKATDTEFSDESASPFTRSDLQWLQEHSHAVVSNPPYLSSTAIESSTGDAKIELPNLLNGDDQSAVSGADVFQTKAQALQPIPLVAMLNVQIELDRQNNATTVDSDGSIIDSFGAQLPSVSARQSHDFAALGVHPRLQLHSQVDSQHWATELGNKLTLLASKDTSSATLYMTPAELGPVQVRIHMNHDQASILFTAEHAETRSALEQSLPRLRELFSLQGMSLTDVGVFGGRSDQQSANLDRNSSGSGAEYTRNQDYDQRHYQGDDQGYSEKIAVQSIHLGLLDAYA
jgi:flagellar hook-length control protein FliK